MVTTEQAIWFEEFCRHEYLAVYRYTYAFIGNPDEAQEVVQESFLTFFRLLVAGEIREHERALLFRLARNSAIDLVRRRTTRQNFAWEIQDRKLVAFRQSKPQTPEEILLEKERLRCANEALARLSSRDQECLALRRSGLTYREVAETMNISPNSVGQTISRALQRFERMYEQLFGRTSHEYQKENREAG